MGVNIGDQSPLYVNPVSVDIINISTSRRQARPREAGSKGSLSAKLRAIASPEVVE
jgi:hypothetical protein